MDILGNCPWKGHFLCLSSLLPRVWSAWPRCHSRMLRGRTIIEKHCRLDLRPVFSAANLLAKFPAYFSNFLCPTHCPKPPQILPSFQCFFPQVVPSGPRSSLSLCGVSSPHLGLLTSPSDRGASVGCTRVWDTQSAGSSWIPAEVFSRGTLLTQELQCPVGTESWTCHLLSCICHISCARLLSSFLLTHSLVRTFPLSHSRVANTNIQKSDTHQQ